MRIMSDKAITKEEVQGLVDTADSSSRRAFMLAVCSFAVSIAAITIALVALVR